MDLKAVNDSIVDLRRSTWDKATSTPAEGVYNFTKKTLVPMRGQANNEHELTWSRYAPENGYRELNAHRAEGFVPVLASMGMYYPQGAFVNPAGMWQYGDAVLIMRPMTMFLEKRAQDVGASDEQMKHFNSDLATLTQGAESQTEGTKLETKRVARLSDTQ